MTGGSVSKSAGVLSRANELERLRQRQGGLAEKLAAAQREKEEAARELQAARYELQVAESQRRSAEDAVLRLQGEVLQHETLLESLRAKGENLEGEREALAARSADSRGRQSAVRDEISAREAEAAGLRETIREKLAGQTDLQEIGRAHV